MRHTLGEPYWAVDEDDSLLQIYSDFNRELVPPGINETFPEGAVGVRVDDDFWTAAALPWSWADVPIEEIVRRLWPSKLDDARFEPDSVQICDHGAKAATTPEPTPRPER